MVVKTHYTLPLGRLIGHIPEHPERTTLRDLPGAFGEIEFRVWPSREALIAAVRLARNGKNPGNLRPYLRNDRDL